MYAQAFLPWRLALVVRKNSFSLRYQKNNDGVIYREVGERVWCKYSNGPHDIVINNIADNLLAQ